MGIVAQFFDLIGLEELASKSHGCYPGFRLPGFRVIEELNDHVRFLVVGWL
jgi:hypothetical protein